MHSATIVTALATRRDGGTPPIDLRRSGLARQSAVRLPGNADRLFGGNGHADFATASRRAWVPVANKSDTACDAVVVAIARFALGVIRRAVSGGLGVPHIYGQFSRSTLKDSRGFAVSCQVSTVLATLRRSYAST